MSAVRPDPSGKVFTFHPEFMAAVQDAETYEAAVACAKGQAWPASTVINADIDVIILSASKSKPSSILLVDADGMESVAAKVAELVKVCAGRSHVVVVGSANDVAFYRSMTQAGASDYLVKPVSSINLREAILPLLSAKSAGEKKAGAVAQQRSGRLFVSVGVRGGVGATTIAVNTAWIMAHEQNKKVALIDLDLQFGNCALALDLEPGRGLREVLANPDRLDSLFINSSMAKESDNLVLFSCEESLEEVVDFDTSGVLALTKELRNQFDVIIVDLPRSLLARHRRLLGTADHVILTSDLTLAGIRDTSRVMAAISGLGVMAPVSIVAGKIGDGEAQVSRSTFERGVHAKVASLIPHDTRSVKLSANRGKSVISVAGASVLANSLRNFAAKLSGIELKKPQASGGFFAFLKGKR